VLKRQQQLLQLFLQASNTIWVPVESVL
jgi:hypothetical protein